LEQTLIAREKVYHNRTKTTENSRQTVRGKMRKKYVNKFARFKTKIRKSFYGKNGKVRPARLPCGLEYKNGAKKYKKYSARAEIYIGT